MQNPVLSFMISTYNKVDYLKIILNDLIDNIGPDEEIIIADGGSTDGTVDLLQELFDKKLIHNFVSERDAGEGHGFNKAILMSKGKIVTFLTDDDVFNYEGIKQCKKIMIENPKLDFLFAGGGDFHFMSTDTVSYFTTEYEKLIREYAVSGKVFSFCMLCSMMNKSSLPLLGFLNPSIKRADAEYSLRITSSAIKIAFYPAPCFVRLLNSKSNSLVFNEKIRAETKKLDAFYDFYLDGPPQEIELVPQSNRISNRIKDVVRPFYRIIFPLKREVVEEVEESVQVSSFNPLSFDEAYDQASSWLKDKYSSTGHGFISNL